MLHELSAIHPKKTLLEMYTMAVSDAPYSFWYVNITRPNDDVLDPV